ncbi:hypothetical protein AMAG_04867 [Allomyces macrogynus ATCC 38327]|uniref:Sequence orphan n=1 Tax=Allomyces macrogynus (strain ATCC 38327) TaxID=578462 RepID=A0A0L0S6L8_ALLM3|nr:hypothetical protein AMAG_04867 [Allomyces macrogynus ATCC 38327]|eukprot:KNE58041.1 hypothetical protein AMAG_04867 [Allomyces macrogynus ATCC 38327]
MPRVGRAFITSVLTLLLVVAVLSCTAHPRANTVSLGAATSESAERDAIINEARAVFQPTSLKANSRRVVDGTPKYKRRAMRDIDLSSDGAVAGSTPFRVQIACPSSTADTLCARMEKAASLALRRIGKVLNLRTTVTVGMAFFAPCQATSINDTKWRSCDQKNILGAAAPAGMQLVRIPELTPGQNGAFSMLPQPLAPNAYPPGHEGVFYVPQSLIRQWGVKVTNPAAMADTDIAAGFNLLRNWWVQGDSANMTSDQDDLEYVILHEMMHGLGFGVDSFSNPASTRLIIPIADNSTTGNGDYQFLYPALWDAFMVDVSASPPNLARNFSVSSPVPLPSPRPWLNGYGDYTTTVVQSAKALNPKNATQLLLDSSTILQLLNKNSSMIKEGTDRYRTATTQGSLALAAWPASEYLPLFANASVLAPVYQTLGTTWLAFPVDTAYDPFQSGSSLAHWDQMFAQGPVAVGGAGASSNFLMASSTLSTLGPRGTLAHGNIPGYNGTYLRSGIGPATVAVLRVLGYQVNGMPPRPAWRDIEWVADEDQQLDTLISSSASLARGSGAPWATVVVAAVAVVVSASL